MTAASRLAFASRLSVRALFFTARFGAFFFARDLFFVATFFFAALFAGIRVAPAGFLASLDDRAVLICSFNLA
jgi:hypothetical protein